MPPTGQALEVELEMIYFLSTAQFTAWVSLGKSHNQIVDPFCKVSAKLGRKNAYKVNCG